MRRFSCANRSALFTPAIYANVTAKREMGVPSAKEFNLPLRLVLFSGFSATAGLIFGAYKIGRYVEKSSSVEGVPFGPKEDSALKTIKPNYEKWDLTGFRPSADGRTLWRPIDPNNPLDECQVYFLEKAKKLGK